MTQTHALAFFSHDNTTIAYEKILGQIEIHWRNGNHTAAGAKVQLLLLLPKHTVHPEDEQRSVTIHIMPLFLSHVKTYFSVLCRASLLTQYPSSVSN
jgi:hypothetical protein